MFYTAWKMCLLAADCALPEALPLGEEGREAGPHGETVPRPSVPTYLQPLAALLL